MTRKSIRWFLNGMAAFRYKVWCQLCGAEFPDDTALAAHTFSAHPRGK